MNERLSPKRKFERTVNTIAAATLAGFLSHAEPAHSIEIPSDASWNEGISLLQRGVVLEHQESVAWFLKGSRDKWVTPPTSGEPDFRLYKPDTDAALPSAEGVQKVCELHNHVLATFVRAQQMGMAPREPSADAIAVFQKAFEMDNTAAIPPIDSPPSLGDVSFKRQQDLHVRLKAKYGPNVAVEHGVKSLQGIWYFKALSDKGTAPALPSFEQRNTKLEQPPASPSLFDSTNRYLTALRTNSDQEQALADLVQSYRSLDVIVRFVSNHEIDKEPACAGVDYVPN